MNYYLDTEFNEDFDKPMFGRCRHFIDLISIGLVCEDGRDYYAVSKDFDLKAAWNKHELKNGDMGEPPYNEYWLRENVLRPLHKHLCRQISGDMKNSDYFYNLTTFSYKSLKRLIDTYGKTNEQIAADIQCFTAGVWDSTRAIPQFTNSPNSEQEIVEYVQKQNRENSPIFYAYYADYDWVVFCSLFGKMINLPQGYPQYCRDLKQLMDQMDKDSKWLKAAVPGGDEHHALADANWNKKLHIALGMADLQRACDQIPMRSNL